jgi:hypothetical protein
MAAEIGRNALLFGIHARRLARHPKVVLALGGRVKGLCGAGDARDNPAEKTPGILPERLYLKG